MNTNSNLKKRPDGWYDIRPDETKAERKSRMARATYLEYVKNNPGAETKSSREYRQKHGYTPWPAQRATAQEVADIKTSNPCTDCSIYYPQECMDFDHTGGDKENNVGTMVAHGHNRDKIMAEIAKCELVCANCHRTRTRKRRLANGQVPLVPEDC